MSEFKGPEALSWLTNNKSQCALAGNRFQTTAEAIEAVKELYAAAPSRSMSGFRMMNQRESRETEARTRMSLKWSFPRGRPRKS